MATRPSRDESPGAVHHVVPQGNERRRIVEDDRDRRAYLARFGRIRSELRWSEVAGCLMDTHHHAIVQTAQANLSAGMQRLQGGHSRWLNARHGAEGQVFRHRYWSRRIYDDAWLFQAAIYIVVNPVAAGLCAHPRDWPWGTYLATAGGDPDEYTPGEELLLAMFGDTPREARRCYAEVIDEATELVRERRLADGRAVWRALSHISRCTALAEERVSG